MNTANSKMLTIISTSRINHLKMSYIISIPLHPPDLRFIFSDIWAKVGLLMQDF